MLIRRKKKILAVSIVIMISGIIAGGIGILSAKLDKITLPHAIKVRMNR